MKLPLAETLLSVQALIEKGQDALATKTLEQLFTQSKTHEQYCRLAHEVLAHLPKAWLEQTPNAMLLCCRVMCAARENQRLLELLKNSSQQRVALEVYRGWARARVEKYNAALEWPLSIEAQLDSPERGLFWRLRAESLAFLNASSWRESFAQARQYLQGAALGRCWIEEGNYLARSSDLPSARIAWSEALVHLRQDPYYLAWTQNALGMSLLVQDPTRAEGYLLEAERISHQKAALAFRPRALCGLGAARRALGEWERAKFAYQQAIALAKETDDQQQAHWGLGQCLRLLGKIDQALEQFHLAMKALPEAWLNVDLAAAYLLLGNPDRAAKTLSQAEGLEARGQTLALVLRCELARLKHNKQALHLGRKLNFASQWVNEERLCFPELFAWLKGQGLAMPEPKPYPECTRVRVRAAGVLQVWVNGRAVPLSPTGRAAEVLVRLLEGGGSEDTRTLIHKLYPKTVDNERLYPKARSALWNLVEDLRGLLGWEGCIETIGSAYRLDPQAHWDYDLADPAIRHKGLFLSGVDQDWVDEYRGYIASTPPPTLDTTRLNRSDFSFR